MQQIDKTHKWSIEIWKKEKNFFENLKKRRFEKKNFWKFEKFEKKKFLPTIFLKYHVNAPRSAFQLENLF